MSDLVLESRFGFVQLVVFVYEHSVQSSYVVSVITVTILQVSNSRSLWVCLVLGDVCVRSIASFQQYQD